MNHNRIEIKEKRVNFLTLGVLWLVLSVGSLFFALMPYLYDFASEKKMAFLIIGGLSFVFFASMFVLLLLRELKPQNALVLSNRGFLAATLGNDVLIEWTNVSGIGIFGTKKMPLFGIRLENNDIVIAQLSSRAAEEMRENLEDNLPSILIRQQDIRTPLKELKELFNKFIRESRALGTAEAQKPKSNPFSTEDVIRAFGGSEADVADYMADSAGAKKTAVSDSEVHDVFSELDTSIPLKEESVKKQPSGSQDEFFEILQKKTASPVKIDSAETRSDFSASAEAGEQDTAKAAPAAQAVSDQAVSDEDIEVSDEINELLSSVKLTKIPEIEKMLSDPNLPYSLSRDAQVKTEASIAPVIKPMEDASPKQYKGNDIHIVGSDELTTSEKAIRDAILPSIEKATRAEADAEQTAGESVTAAVVANVPVETELLETEPQKSEDEASVFEAPAAEPKETVVAKAHEPAKDERTENESGAVEFDFSSLTKTEPEKKTTAKKATEKKQGADEDYPPVVIFDDDEDSKPRKKTSKSTAKNESKVDPTDFFFVATIDDK